MKPGKSLAVFSLAFAFAAPARAQCLGPCLDRLSTQLAVLAVYGLVVLVILVMLARRKWRQAGLWLLALGLGVGIGVPLVSQGWQALVRFGMEQREVVGTPPALAGRVPLLIVLAEGCDRDLCDALLSVPGAEIYALPLARLAGLDLTKPLPLVDLPVERWSRDKPNAPGAVKRALSPEERRTVAARIDYLVVKTEPLLPKEPGQLEAALRANPALKDMGKHDVLRLALAPIAPGGALSLADLQFDLLDLSLERSALDLPLAPENWRPARNRPAGSAVAIAALCPVIDGEAIWYCRHRLE